MISTYFNYQLIARDIGKSLNNVANQPMVERETAYYRENIGKVRSIEEFVGNDRLFRYAMKAHGLEDMAYAKAFMVKVLKEGVTDPDSFANKLNDKRYADFAKTYDFARRGEMATVFNRALHDAPANFALQVGLNAAQAGYAFVEEETSFFLDNIANVKSIDNLIDSPRLLRYAMISFGLDPDEEPVARVRQMLEGGVTDPDSPANSLGDKRYASFVTAFNFVEHGEQTTSREAVQTYVPRAFVAGSGLTLPNGGSTPADAEVAYFKSKIGEVRSVGDLIGDKRLLTFAMAAFGLDANSESPLTVRQMLVGGVSDPASPANQLEDKRYAAFVTAFNFAEYGAAATARDDVIELTPKRYLESANPENAYFRANITSVKSVGDLLRNERLLTYAMAAYGLDAKKEPRDLVRNMLLGGAADPNSLANQSGDARYRAFVAAFDFVAHGEATTSRAEVVERTPRFHVENVNPETAYFRANIGKVTSIRDLMADTRLLTYAMAAYGLDAATESPATVKKMLEGGITSPSSPANLRTDKSYARFVAAFDFVTHGAATTARTEVMDATPTRYTKMNELGLVKVSAEYIKAETDYYKANVTQLRSIDDLLADKRLLDYALRAYGLDPARQTPERIREMLEGGVSDPDSPANKLTDKSYAAFVSAFNFAEYGEETTTRTPALEPTVAKYLRQTLEEDAGEQNEGVRLALYFERKIGSITNAYEILADKALSRVVRTALGFPESLATADIDKQAQLIESRLDLEELKEPDTLKKFLQRYTTMHELDNPSSPAPSVGILFSQPTEFGISTDLMMSMQKMRL
ncbi:MAG: DUF1217 domain-containing protein [Rhizobiaceae bacterium]|nr:DUF1217 domain-containing protein [Rhizobiaceae bacterium]MCV0407028.1 DUF1217 domain-containing protein [Rhizobiaceae bacterium]